jgi:hypothetical protein
MDKLKAIWNILISEQFICTTYHKKRKGGEIKYNSSKEIDTVKYYSFFENQTKYN